MSVNEKKAMRLSLEEDKIEDGPSVAMMSVQNRLQPTPKNVKVRENQRKSKESNSKNIQPRIFELWAKLESEKNHSKINLNKSPGTPMSEDRTLEPKLLNKNSQPTFASAKPNPKLHNNARVKKPVILKNKRQSISNPAKDFASVRGNLAESQPKKR